MGIQVLAILVLMSGALLLLIASELRKEIKEPSFYDYIEDKFERLTWRWRYSTSGNILNLWCYCPICDTVLTYEELIDHYGYRDRYTHFNCDHHGEIVKIKGDCDSIVACVERQIDRNIRTGDYKAVLESRQPSTENT